MQFQNDILQVLGTEYQNNLDIEGFSNMMKDPSYCYKFYWLEAIVNLISEGNVTTNLVLGIYVVYFGHWNFW